MCDVCFLSWSGGHRDLHVRTHAFPTRRSSALVRRPDRPAGRRHPVDNKQHVTVQAAGTVDDVIEQMERGEQPCDADLAIMRANLRAAMDAGIHLGEIRSEEHTSELQSLLRIPYAVFCLKKKKHITSPIY